MSSLTPAHNQNTISSDSPHLDLNTVKSLRISFLPIQNGLQKLASSVAFLDSKLNVGLPVEKQYMLLSQIYQKQNYIHFKILNTKQ